MAAKTVKNEIFVSGKRKTAVAKLRLVDGTGKIFYNGLSIESLSLFHRLALIEPVRIYEKEIGTLKKDLYLTTLGGGKEGQIQAARLAIAKGFVKMTASETLRKAYVLYDRNIIVPDSRRKETRKPGDSKARAKRQKSYR